MNIFQVNKYYPLIKAEQQKKLSLHILHLVKDLKQQKKQLKNKQKQLNNNNKKRKQVKALKVFKPFTQKLTIKDALPGNTVSEEAKNKLNKTKEIEKMVVREICIIKRINIHIIF